MRLALACEVYRSRHGRYPAKLERLAPGVLGETPPDPFTGRPFAYKLKPGGGFMVYSLGEDLEDDGGRFTGTNWQDGDICWERR